MNPPYPEYWPQFFTATILNWKPLLADDQHKDIIVDSLQFLVKEKRIKLFAFVIMSNHIHLIWQPMAGHNLSGIQASFLKYTAQQLKRRLTDSNIAMLDEYKVNKYDRNYQFWKRDSLSIELISESVFKQKLAYIHNNPVKAGLCMNPEDYHYSSARFYYYGIDEFNMITHISGN